MSIEGQGLSSNPRISCRPITHTYSHISNYGTSIYPISSIMLIDNNTPKLYNLIHIILMCIVVVRNYLEGDDIF